VWGQMAENCAKYLAKGRQVYVEGRIETQQYQDKEGVTRYSTKIVARQVTFLGGGQGQQGGGGQGRGEPQSGGYGRSSGGQPGYGRGGGQPDQDYGPSPSDEDIPF